MGLNARHNGKQDDDSIIRQVPGKQKKPGKSIILGFPGPDTKTALRMKRFELLRRFEADLPHFECGPFNHLGTSPYKIPMKGTFCE